MNSTSILFISEWYYTWLEHNLYLTICLFCQIIGIYTHLNPMNLWYRATNIFISLLIHLFFLFATIRRYSSLFATICTIRSPFGQYSSLFATVCTIRSLLVTIRHYSRLFALFGHYSSLFITIRDCLHYSVTIRHYSRLFVTIRSLFVTIRHYSVTIRHYSVTIRHYSSLFATIRTIRVILQVQQCFCWVKG